MPDPYEAVRSLPFPAVAATLGLAIKHYKSRNNGEHYGPCPIHGSKQNQTCFSYHPDGRFNCFSCSAKGRGALDLVMKVRSIGFKQAVELLEATKPSAPPEKPASNQNSASSEVVEELRPLEKDTWRKFQVPCEWLEQRIPDAGVRERYGVFAYNNPARKSAYSGRVMLPVKNPEGILYGYLGRHIGDTAEAKYLFPKNLPKSRFLFGSAEIAAGMFGPAPLRVVYLVESPFCVMKFASLGLPAISPYGWSVSQEQIELLTAIARGIVYLPDRNKADQIAQVALALSNRIWVRCPPLPAGIDDPEQMSREQILAL